jgi:ribosome-associated toxin RatA of RatAB toxin-antitoxin module
MTESGNDSAKLRAPFRLGGMPVGRKMVTLDEAVVHAPVERIFALARDVEQWPRYLPHYRHVRFRSRNRDGGGVVEMSANRPFGPLNWPTRWVSQMSVDDTEPNVRYRHIEGITTHMDVEWTFTPLGEDGKTGRPDETLVRIFHVWDGPEWPFIGAVAAVGIIGPVFVHGIASRTLHGLKKVAEQSTP